MSRPRRAALVGERISISSVTPLVLRPPPGAEAETTLLGAKPSNHELCRDRDRARVRRIAYRHPDADGSPVTTRRRKSQAGWGSDGVQLVVGVLRGGGRRGQRATSAQVREYYANIRHDRTEIMM